MSNRFNLQKKHYINKGRDNESQHQVTRDWKTQNFSISSMSSTTGKYVPRWLLEDNMCDWRQLKIKSIYFQKDIFENLSPKFSKLIGVWTGKLSLEVPTLGLESKTWKLNKKWKLKPNEERVRRTKTKRAQTKQTLSSPDLWSKSKDNKEKRRGSHLLI